MIAAEVVQLYTWDFILFVVLPLFVIVVFVVQWWSRR